MRIYDASSDRWLNMVECPCCDGLGTVDMGSCDEEMIEHCDECDGTGLIDDNNDPFVPERDAWRVQD